MIKPVLGNTTPLLLGGMRTVNYMEGVLKNHYANFISMSRPFIRDPFLVIKIEKGTIVTIFPDSNKKYLSTDLLREEPVKDNFLSTGIKLNHFRAYKRVCHTCCDPSECVERDYQGDSLKLPHCPRRH